MTQWNVKDFVRPHILTLTPYASARSEYRGEHGVFLDANENPLGSATQVAFNRYPDPLQQALKDRLAELRRVSPLQIFIGNGSDEAIDLLMRAFCEPRQDHILIMPPTYGMYSVSAAINQIDTISVPLTPSFQIQLDTVLTNLVPGCKMVFICSPNNPTGNLLRDDDIHHIIHTQQHGLVIVDEAYIDFSNSKGFVSFLDQYPNLVILQTFSKAWGLAGLRLGAAYAHPDIIDILNRIKPPYNVNTYTQEKGLEALSQTAKMEEMIRTILDERQRLTDRLAQHPMVQEIYPSEANFILVKIPHAEKIYHYLLKKLIIVRNRAKVFLCEDCLRISIGTSQENDVLLEALEHINYEAKDFISG